MSSYSVNLQVFEGPMDLLIHLIRKNDLNIYDIPVALILDQYLEYLEVMRELDIDLAGEFILMASELSHIKSKMLLHREGDEEEEGDDPRADLIARLLEYQQYKLAARWLLARPLLARDVFKRPDIDQPEDLEPEEAPLEVEPFVLLNAFNEILKKIPKGKHHTVETERISVTERIYQIMDLLKGEDSVAFESFFAGEIRRSDVVITFLAILEMGKLKMIQIYQTDRFGPIRVRRKIELTDAAIDPTSITASTETLQ